MKLSEIKKHETPYSKIIRLTNNDQILIPIFEQYFTNQSQNSTETTEQILDSYVSMRLNHCTLNSYNIQNKSFSPSLVSIKNINELKNLNLVNESEYLLFLLILNSKNINHDLCEKIFSFSVLKNYYNVSNYIIENFSHNINFLYKQKYIKLYSGEYIKVSPLEALIIKEDFQLLDKMINIDFNYLNKKNQNLLFLIRSEQMALYLKNKIDLAIIKTVDDSNKEFFDGLKALYNLSGVEITATELVKIKSVFDNTINSFDESERAIESIVNIYHDISGKYDFKLNDFIKLESYKNLSKNIQILMKNDFLFTESKTISKQYSNFNFTVFDDIFLRILDSTRFRFDPTPCSLMFLAISQIMQEKYKNNEKFQETFMFLIMNNNNNLINTGTKEVFYDFEKFKKTIIQLNKIKKDHNFFCLNFHNSVSVNSQLSGRDKIREYFHVLALEYPEIFFTYFLDKDNHNHYFSYIEPNKNFLDFIKENNLKNNLSEKTKEIVFYNILIGRLPLSSEDKEYIINNFKVNYTRLIQKAATIIKNNTGYNSEGLKDYLKIIEKQKLHKYLKKSKKTNSKPIISEIYAESNNISTKTKKFI